ncbi:MAG: hypothetical protein VZS44_12010 [Bacilli bacterium]|jgi:hypothetical protein|nr:hypothetical protein [Bacilli bacterium]
MFKTLFVKNISESYNKRVREHNGDIDIKKYLASFGLYNGIVGHYEEEYKLCFLLLIENSFGDKKRIVFGYKYNDKERYSKYKYRPDVIIGGDIRDNAPEQAIYKFCSHYGEYLLDGFDIEDIAANDGENIFNYVFEKKLSKTKKQ